MLYKQIMTIYKHHFKLHICHPSLWKCVHNKDNASCGWKYNWSM